MIKYLLVVGLLHLSVQQDNDWPKKPCNFEKCEMIYELDMSSQGLEMHVESEMMSLHLQASDGRFPPLTVPLEIVLTAESGKLLATMSECKQTDLGLELESLQGVWAVKLSKDRVQISLDGDMVMHYEFNDPCSVDFKSIYGYKTFIFTGLKDSDIIDISPVITGDNDCPYNQYPDLSKCTRPSDKCYAQAMTYCSCGGLSGWDEELCRNSEKPEPGNMEVDCDMCPEQQGNDWPKKACDFDECSTMFYLDMSSQGAELDIKSDTMDLYLHASDGDNMLLKMKLTAESGTLLVTFGDCKQTDLGIEKLSLKGVWGVKISKDRIQISFNGVMVIYYDFNEPCSKKFTETDGYKVFMFKGVEGSDDIEVSPLTSDDNDCPYNQYPDLSKCTRHNDKCYAQAMVYCSCGGLSWWDEENCRNSEKPEPGNMEVDCDMCPGDSDNNNGGENETCHDWEWGRDECMDYGDGCKYTRYPKECKCGHGCDRWPDKKREWCEPHECRYISSALSVKVSALFMVSTATGLLLR